MFKDEYSELMSEIAPSPALNEETLALMQEAQQHPASAPKPKKQLAWILPFSLSATAAVLALVLGLNAHFSRPTLKIDDAGENSLLAGTDSLNSATNESADTTNKQENSEPATNEENASATTDGEKTEPSDSVKAEDAPEVEQAPAVQGEVNENTEKPESTGDQNTAKKPESSGTAAEKPQSGSDAATSAKPENDKATSAPNAAEKPQSGASSGTAAEKPQASTDANTNSGNSSAAKPQSGTNSGNASASKPQSGTNSGNTSASKPNNDANDAPTPEAPEAGGNAAPAPGSTPATKPDSSTSSDETADSKPSTDATGDANTPEKEEGKGEATDTAKPIDPKAPVEINDKQTETYLSLRDYVDALAAKKTIGYGENYLGDSALAIVPSWLPKSARFRQIYAYANGGYTYSYLISDAKETYYLNIAVGATPPKTMRDLNLRTRGIKTEEIKMVKSANQRAYYFGNYDKVTITVTSLAGKKPTQAQVDALLDPFDLARYTEQNKLVEATYE